MNEKTIPPKSARVIIEILKNPMLPPSKRMAFAIEELEKYAEKKPDDGWRGGVSV